MARVRKLVGTDRVVARGGGYALELPEAAVDVYRFRDRVARARVAAPGEEEQLLAEALALWRGEPLEGVDSDTLCAEHVYPLTEEWFAATERLLELRVTAGAAGEVVGELRGLIARHPLRESLWALLMSALVSAGRQADALAAYQEVRAALRDQLGVDPGPALATHAAVLEGGSTPARRVPPAEPAAPPPVPIPHQVPAGPPGFAGRANALQELDDLADAWHDDDGRTTVAVVDGAGGMGKTALALHWAHRAGDRFPDGQLYLNLRGFGPGEPVDPTWAAGTLLSTFGAADDQIPAARSPHRAAPDGAVRQARAGGARQRARRRAGPSASARVGRVRGRDQPQPAPRPVSRDGARRITLAPLSSAESQAMLEGSRPAQRPRSPRELADLCGRVPLALAVAAERVARTAEPEPTDLLTELRDEQGRLDALSSGDDLTTDVRAVLSWSYRIADTDAARLFRLLSLAPGPDISAPAAAALAGLPVGRTRQLLDRLCAAHLLDEKPGRRYEQHDLIRAYAAELASAEDDPGETETAVGRLLHWYQATAINARDALRSNLTMSVADRPDVEPLEFGGRVLAAAWFDDERPNLVDAVWLAARTGKDDAAWQLAAALNNYFNVRRPWDHRIPVFECGLDCARRSGDRSGQAMLLKSLGDTYHFLHDYARSVSLSQQALAIYRELGDDTAQIGMHTNIGMSLTEAGETEAALEHHRLAAQASRALDDPSVRALVIGNLAGGYNAAERYAEAVETAEEALVVARLTGDPFVEANTVEELGQALSGLGSYAEAIAHFQRALEVYRSIGHPYEAAVLHHLGGAHLAAGHPERARETWRRALTRALELDDPLATEVRAKLAALR